MESGVFLDVAVAQGKSILQLLPPLDKSEFIGRDAFFFLDYDLDLLYCVRKLNIEGDGLASHCLHEDLHSFEISYK